MDEELDILQDTMAEEDAFADSLQVDRDWETQ